MNDVTIVQADHPFAPSKRQFRTVEFSPGLMIGDLFIDIDLDPADCCIIYNGLVATDTKTLLKSGDVLHVYPNLHDDPLKAVGLIALSVLSIAVIGPAVTGLLTPYMSTTAAGVWGTLAGVATLTAGGLLINSLMADNATHMTRDGTDSPTYGWQAGRNLATEGAAIPVIYGEVASYPHVIGFYIEIDGDGYEWAHSLLCVGEGTTNNVISDAEIYANDEPLNVYDSDNYEVYATDGSASPDTDQLIKFTELHQMRHFDKRLYRKIDSTGVLLHCNGTNGSTLIIDEGFDDNDWTCQATAALSTAHPFIGTADLDLETAGDYISCDNEAGHDIFTESNFDIEVRFRQDVLTDSAICGAEGIDGTTGRYWGLHYNSGNLVFQMYKLVSGTPTIYWNLSIAVTLTIDTWHHVRVARSGLTAFIYLDGVLKTAAVYSNVPTDPSGSATWGVTVGRAYWWNGATAAAAYGNCEIDEYRVLPGQLAYELPSYTPPVVELSSNSNVEAFRTKGKIDKFSLIVAASLGLYDTENDGSLDSLTVEIRVRYRKVGDSTWISSDESITGESRYPVKKQLDYTMVSQGQYDVEVYRLSPESEITTEQDRINWISLDEIVDKFLHYPYLQCVSISLRAQDEMSGAVPTYRINSNISSISVPNFSGTGTQTVNPSNNSWTAFDMLTSTVYAAGLSATRLVEADWSAWETWCDTTIDTYKRAQINMVFDGNYDLDKAMQHVENCGRAKVINRGTSIGVVIEKPGSPTALFADGANIITGTGKLSFLPQAERADAVEITYRDKDANWQQATASSRSAGYESLGRVPRITRLNILGINNTEQATREAIFRRQISENIKRSAEFQSGIEALRQTVGDIINVRNDGNSLTFGGRIAKHPTAGDSYSGTVVYLDQEINLATATYSGNCTLTIRGLDDSLITAVVSGPFDTDTDSVTVSASVTVNRFDPYMITRTSGEITQFKIASVQRSGIQELTVRALQYVAASYYHTDYDSGNTPI